MTTEHMEELNDQQIVRREKMAALREQGIDPFGKRFERTADSGQLKEKYSELDKEQLHDLNETAIIASLIYLKPFVPCLKNSMGFQMWKPSTANATWT